MEQINIKDNEVKTLKSNISIDLKEGEKLIAVIFFCEEENIHYSIICKNTDKFCNIESKLYQEYPALAEKENFFMNNGKKINKFKTIEENDIKFSGIILVYSMD